MKKLILGMCLFLAACMPYTVSDMPGLYSCPHPISEVKQAERFLGDVYEVDGYNLSLICTGGQLGARLLGCTMKIQENPNKYGIFILEGQSKEAKIDTYYHELCHVYEIEYMNKDVESSRHEGWIRN